MNEKQELIQKYPSHLWRWGATEYIARLDKEYDGKPWRPNATRFYRKQSMETNGPNIWFLWDDTNQVEALWYLDVHRVLLTHPQFTEQYMSLVESMAGE